MAGIEGESAAVLDAWFGPLCDAATIPEKKLPRWFEKNADFDRELGERFGELVSRASRGVLTHWAESPRGRLSLLILLDQMRRNIFRGRPEAFAADPLALAYALEGIRLGHDQAVYPIERVFFYLPLEHCEDLELQRRCVQLFTQLKDDGPPQMASLMQEYLRYAVMHHDVIRDYGRFPHRNVVLGRASTEREEHFLTQPGSRF